MDEENPLLIVPTGNRVPEGKSQYYNLRGRPKIIDIIKFGPQPQSVISQLLNKIKTENVNEIILKSQLITNDADDNCGSSNINMGKDCSNDKELVENNVINTESSTICPNLNTKYDVHEEIEIICQFCLHRSDTVKEHKKHLKEHKNDKRYFCDYSGCSYVCKLSSNLTKHKRVHTGEKPYFCDQCAFRTNFVNSLKTHKRIHTLERPYACKNCNYRANSSSNLKKHCSHRHSDGYKKFNGE